MYIFETSRLVVSKFSLEDAAFIIQLLNTEGWLKYIGDRGVKNVADAETYLQNRLLKGYEDQGFGFWKVTLKETNQPIGMCGLVKRDGLDDVDIGFAFLPKYESMGYGYEAASATIKLARNTFKLPTLVAITVHYNASSIALLQKLGFQFSKTCVLPSDKEELMLFVLDLDK